MRRLTLVILAAALIYSAYWFIGARTVTSQTTSALVEMQAQGWGVQYTDLDTRGFPNRFDTTLTEIRLTAPDGLIIWTAPFFQVFALSYQPNKVIAVFPNSQTIDIAGRQLDITSEGLRASAAVGALTTVPLREVTLETGPLRADASELGSLTLASGLAALRDIKGEANDYNAYLNLTEITPPFDAAAATQGALPDQIAHLTADVMIVTSKPIDRLTGEGDPLRPTALTVRGITLLWGDVQLTLTGDMTINEDGDPTGTVEVTLQNWETALLAAQNAGLVDAQTAMTYAATARGAADGKSSFTLPITLTEGAASMGFIPLGRVDFWD